MNKVNLLTILLLIITCISIYLIIFQSYHSYGPYLAATCLFLIFACILLLQFLWINIPSGSIWTSSVRTVATVLVMIPVAYALIHAENNYENKNLEKDSVHTTALISHTYKTTGNKVGVSYHAVYQYVVNGETYTHTLTYSHDIYHFGDTVEIIYSSQYPQIDKMIRYRSKRVASGY